MNGFESEPAPWWRPDVHADRRGRLLARGAIKTAIRGWLNAQGFIEVETGCLQVSPGNETHLHAFATEAVGTDGRARPLYLHTSPEFAMKKLLAAGEEKIFTFAPCFRNREQGALNVAEFTMLEWYRAGEPYESLMADCEAMLRIAAEVTGRWDWSYKSRTCDIRKGRDWTTLYQAFFDFASIKLDDCFSGPDIDLASMRREVARVGIRVGADDTWSDLFSRVMVEKIEPYLGLYRPEILCGYPAHEAALARPVEDDKRVAERFELYVCAVELANGFGELTDATALRRNLEAQMAERERRYGERYPIDPDFLAAVATMRPAAGCALGFDRLVMLAVGAQSVDDVIWTPGSTRGPAPPDEGQA